MISLNDFMHPRNPFKIKPDYKLLANKYPEFEEFLIPYSSNKKYKIDFNNPNALRCLSTILLKDQFNLNVNIPIDRLIPSIPQRLNYILWLEDLIDKCIIQQQQQQQYSTGKQSQTIKLNLIDCGTGASCVFPLISTKLNSNWYFLATELDDYSLECARQNCQVNNLSDRINVIKGDSTQLIPEGFDDVEYVALMCNPPFFEDRTEDCRSSLSNTSQLVESTVDGGEESFVSKLIEESFNHQTKIKLYTVMLGKQMSFKNLKTKLQSFKDDGILNYTDTEFCQGKKIRFGLCWTFDLSIDLNLVYKIKHPKKKSPTFVHKIPSNKFVYTYTLKIVANHILELLAKIDINKIHLTDLKQSKHRIEFTIKTNLNTWSNQRRKRRLAKRQQQEQLMNELNDDCENEDVIIEAAGDDSEQKGREKAKKRLADELDDSSFEDLEFNQQHYDEQWKKAKFTEQTSTDEEYYLLNCQIKIQEENDKIYLKMTANNRIKDRDSVHQLFQYLKNNLSE